MKLFGKSSTLELPPDNAADASPPDKPFTEIIADVLHERLPRVPVPDLRSAIEILGPDILQSLEMLNRRRILEAIELLPIDKFSERIASASKPARAARDNLATVSRDLALLNTQAEEISASGDFNPAAFAELRGKISALQSRLADATPLRLATEKLVSVIEEVGAHIHQLSRLQNDRSPSIGLFFGRASHGSVSAKVITDPVVRTTRILEIAETALTELERLQRGELPEAHKPNGFGNRERVSIMNLSFWV
jgi:hypothetical protein